MKKFLFLISLVTMLISCTRHEIVISEDQIPEDKFYYSDAVTPFTGKCVVMFNNSSNIKEVMHFREGLLDGSWVSYYPDGTVRQKGVYKDGMFNGKWESWSELGSKLYEVYYQNDSLTGKYTTWHRTGKIKEKGEYIANQRTGTWLWYSESGDLMQKSDYGIN